ncbi:hypothetical protein EYZ11_005933 [Aspergillus tanneri]|uniref:Myb-like DNA-binding domain-containing protein n=1 Tax=Aspergillus tanneri TaxID=1220188 RepID=A0A4S3JGT4_9EURO|nr:uncharacterized protein ATNIH1004_010409 [Aspergillus tanneri]KAA8643640.1 hypothetical protein ATNIH1004_010409 [Aspergillus tanneri]THC94573.1 hypothetical protein EYZ11_005933 [Aspergillus tanneri]
MSSNGKTTTTDGDISQQDAKFIMECVKNLDQNKQVDLAKVGEALGYTNVASVGNRFRVLRKRYGFANLDCINTSPAPKIGVAKGESPATPTKPAGKSTRSKSAKAINAMADETVTIKAEDKGSDVSMDDEPVSPVKAKTVSPRKAPRKGAKVSSKPIPATGPVTSDAGTSNTGAKIKKEDGISTALLEAVEVVVKKEVETVDSVPDTPNQA